MYNKHALDQLLLYYLIVDYKIKLIEGNNLYYSPLYYMTTEELIAIKEYLLENLYKGFIILSNTPFASPILFVSKLNRGLHFYIDYRKLNSITKKD